MSNPLLTSVEALCGIPRHPQTHTTTPLVLIVDDHPDTRELLRFAIERHGYGVVEASDGEEAVRIAEQMLPALILMDTSLPRVDGLMATRRIRQLENAQNVWIIFLSGHAEPQRRVSAMAAGGNDYFVKPVNLEALERAVEKQLTMTSRASS
jgi:CheY-like chemotaxis protein